MLHIHLQLNKANAPLFWILSLFFYFRTILECDRLGCEWCYSYPNGTHVPDKDKVCNNTGYCFRQPPSPTTMATTTVAPTVTPTTGPVLSGGAIAGIVIAIVVLILIILGMVYYFMQKRKTPVPTNQSNQPKPPSPVIIANPNIPDVVQESDWFWFIEIILYIDICIFYYHFNLGPSPIFVLSCLSSVWR